MATGITARWYQSDDPIDGTDTGTYDVETTLAEGGYTRDFYLHGVSVLITNLNNAPIPASINVGTNSPNYNNMINGASIGGATGQILPLSLAAAVGVTAQATDIKCKVVSPASALLGSPTCEFKVIVHGHDLIY